MPSLLSANELHEMFDATGVLDRHSASRRNQLTYQPGPDDRRLPGCPAANRAPGPVFTLALLVKR